MMADTTSGFNHSTGKAQADEAKRHVKSMMREKQVFEDKAAEYRGKLHSQQTHDKIELDRRHQAQKTKLDKKLHDTYGADKNKDRHALQALKDKQEKAEQTKKEQARAQDLQKNLASIKQRETEQHDKLKTRQEADRQKLAEKHDKQSSITEHAVSAARQDRQSKGWKPEPVNFERFQQQSDEKISFQKPARLTTEGSNSSQGSEEGQKGVAGAPRPKLEPKGMGM